MEEYVCVNTYTEIKEGVLRERERMRVKDCENERKGVRKSE